MAYTAEVSRANPGAFVFLIDQPKSMEEPFGGVNGFAHFGFAHVQTVQYTRVKRL